MARIMFSYIKIIIFSLISSSSFGNSVKSEKWRSKDASEGIAKCISTSKKCLESGKRNIDGIDIYKKCWKYSYVKNCDFPSKNNCYKYSQCYELGIKDCLTFDSSENCVNEQKEFSCKEQDLSFLKRQKAKIDPKGDEANKILCKGMPCIDGNCIDKSYKMDEDIIESVSKLYAISYMNNSKGFDSQIFRGTHQYCTKKPSEYMSCCKLKGWGASLGAKCKPDEIDLKKKREKNLCIYIGKTTNGQKPFHTNKHHFCCFGNILNKVFQVEGRKQLGVNFGSPSSPNCRGFSIEEISSIDFNKIDFSEFAFEIKKTMKIPKNSDLVDRIKNTISETDQEILKKE